MHARQEFYQLKGIRSSAWSLGTPVPQVSVVGDDVKGLPSMHSGVLLGCPHCPLRYLNQKTHEHTCDPEDEVKVGAGEGSNSEGFSFKLEVWVRVRGS